LIARANRHVRYPARFKLVSAEVRARVRRAREVLGERFEPGPDGRRQVKADMPPGDLDRFALSDAPGAAPLADAAVKLALTARDYLAC
jgi:predicted ATPase with chaperone activity